MKNQESSGSHQAQPSGGTASSRFPIAVLIGLALAAGLCFPTRSSAQATEPKSAFQILVFNYTDASPEGLAVGEREAGRILAQAGIQVTWLNCPVIPGGSPSCTREVAASDIRVRIVTLPKPGQSTFNDSVFGFAIAPAFASVYYQSAQRLAKLDDADFEMPVILGCVIAHEIGHLLLGPNSHSASGVMQPQWERKQVQQAMMGRMMFAPEQARVIRSQMQSRTQQQLPEETEARR